MDPLMASRPRGRFGDTTVVRQGWYCLAPSRRVRGTKPIAVQVGQRRVLLHRDAGGRVRATDDRCPHLGADLALGKVTDRGLECGFHGWCWGEGGACVAAPGTAALPPRRLRSYAVEERWGFAWAWIGAREPGIPLPDQPAHLPHAIRLRPQRVKGSVDIVYSNVFDMAHFRPSHGITARTTALREEAPWRMVHDLSGEFPRRPVFRAVGLAGRAWEATATQTGGGILHVHFHSPVEYVLAFAMRPDADAAARTQTIVFLRRRRDLPTALAFLWTAVVDDLRLMSTMQWTGAFAETDASLAAYARFMEAMPTW